MLAGYSVAQIAVIIIIIAAIVAITFVILRQMGINPPAWLITIMWIILAAVVGIFAIRLLLGLVGGGV